VVSIISTKEHYDNLIDENNDPVHDPEPLQEYMNKWDGSKFLSELRLNRKSSVLEIGVGTGRLAIRVLKQGCKQFVGIDLSEKTISAASENLKKFANCNLIAGDYLKVHFQNTFDIIYSSLTFFHIEDKVSAIKKCWTLLNTNGRFILSLDKNSLEFLDYGRYKVKIFPDDLKSTVALLDEWGFSIENISETDFAYIISAAKLS
jgi:ubiquinone/menaquinone biosynthesis C-methylase UbiE